MLVLQHQATAQQSTTPTPTELHSFDHSPAARTGYRDTEKNYYNARASSSVQYGIFKQHLLCCNTAFLLGYLLRLSLQFWQVELGWLDTEWQLLACCKDGHYLQEISRRDFGAKVCTAQTSALCKLISNMPAACAL